MVLNQKNGAV